MKKCTNFVLTVTAPDELPLGDVEAIRFKFKQGAVVKFFEYPSDTAFRVDETQNIALRWTIEDTLRFDPKREIQADTFVTLTEVRENPQTEPFSVMMNPTLFEREEVIAND